MHSSRFEDKAADAAASTLSAAAEFAGDAKAKVDGLMNQTATTAGQVYDQAREQVRGAASAVASSMERQPGTALLVVGLVCGALGFLLGRR